MFGAPFLRTASAARRRDIPGCQQVDLGLALGNEDCAPGGNAQSAWVSFCSSTRLNTATRAVFPPVRGTDVKQTACPHINSAAILIATARKLKRVEAISVQHRYRQIAVARNSVRRAR
jgi:hypothetical protein